MPESQRSQAGIMDETGYNEDLGQASDSQPPLDMGTILGRFKESQRSDRGQA